MANHDLEKVCRKCEGTFSLRNDGRYCPYCGLDHWDGAGGIPKQLNESELKKLQNRLKAMNRFHLILITLICCVFSMEAQVYYDEIYPADTSGYILISDNTGEFDTIKVEDVSKDSLYINGQWHTDGDTISVGTISGLRFEPLQVGSNWYIYAYDQDDNFLDDVLIPSTIESFAATSGTLGEGDGARLFLFDTNQNQWDIIFRNSPGLIFSDEYLDEDKTALNITIDTNYLATRYDLDSITSIPDGDSDPTNEYQDLSLSGTTLNISDGIGVSLASLQDGNGQWSVSGSNIYRQSNVGIGIINPTSLFHVYGSGKSVFEVVATGTVSERVANHFIRSWQNNNVLFRQGLIGDDEGFMQMYNDGAVANYFRANGNSYINGGNVGIGITSPGAKLHVNGTLRYSTQGGTAVNIVSVDANGTLTTNGSQNLLLDNDPNNEIETWSTLAGIPSGFSDDIDNVDDADNDASNEGSLSLFDTGFGTYQIRSNTAGSQFPFFNDNTMPEGYSWNISGNSIGINAPGPSFAIATLDNVSSTNTNYTQVTINLGQANSGNVSIDSANDDFEISYSTYYNIKVTGNIYTTGTDDKITVYASENGTTSGFKILGIVHIDNSFGKEFIVDRSHNLSDGENISIIVKQQTTGQGTITMDNLVVEITELK